MATRKIIPCADSEGGIGSNLKRWLAGHFVSLFCDNLTYAQLKATGGDGAYLEVPTVSTEQRDVLIPTAGMIVYNSTDGVFQKYEGNAWTIVGTHINGVLGDVPYHTESGWSVENTGPLTTPKRTLVLLGSSFIFPDADGATYYEEALTGGRIVRGAAFGVSQTAVTAQIGLPMPSNWDGGTVTAQFVVATAATTGTVTFGVAGRASVNGDALDQAFGTAQAVTLDIGAQTDPAAWDVWVTGNTSALTLAGSTEGAGRRWVQFEVSRDAGDTCAEDVVLLAVIVEYGTRGFSDA